MAHEAAEGGGQVVDCAPAVVVQLALGRALAGAVGIDDLQVAVLHAAAGERANAHLQPVAEGPTATDASPLAGAVDQIEHFFGAAMSKILLHGYHLPSGGNCW